ncbi:DUF5676 family membrane protein [Microbulbifer magnicolonia]|uniref:DUF5676 family membrane protein n=1 Tax=Microbulbifer magnicolonia TaxID=3109744 RepID=UPI002B416A7B|nr:DUF5676 family membrane protein [Microbulbifer sp. GG15]
MPLHTLTLGLTGGIGAAILWLVCGVLVMLFPSMLLSLCNDMLPGQQRGPDWHLTLVGAINGLLYWMIIAAITGWLLAAVYKRLLA